MRRTLTATLTAAVMTLGAVAFAAPATATEEVPPPEQCVEREAWTEVIEHPAVGEPTITVPNPDYVPAVDEVSHEVEHPAEYETVHHPAETEVVKHDAEYRTEYHFAKFVRERTKSADVKGFWQVFSPTEPKTFQGPPSWPSDSRGKWSAPKYNGGPQQGASGVFQNGGGNGSWFYRAQPVEGTWSDYGDWSKWSPETHTSWELTTDPIGTPQFHSSGVRDGVKWERQWQARYDGQTRQVKTKDAWEETVVVKEAWDEQVLVKEAWTEKVIDVEAKPAQGEPTIEVSNPDYVPAWTETIEHPAVECPVVIPPKPDDLVRTASSQEIDCDNGIVTETWTEETATHVWDEEAEAWIVGEWSEPVVTHTPQHVLTEEEREVVCPTVTPEPEPEPEPQPEPEPEPEPTVEPKPEPTVEPTVEPTPVADNGPRKELAATGGDHVVPLTVGALGVAMLALGGALAVRRRSQD